MTEQNEAEWLTAAECASRTGLTVRALRVYEEYGLISPKRTGSGWRRYGTAELVRLNTIATLKTAGLTLAQIRSVARVGDVGPSLQQVLEIQVDTWRARRADAERGQAMAEAALDSLNSHESLTIDELCNLARSLEISDQRPIPNATLQEQPDVAVDPQVLDSYVGHYRVGEYAALSITREGGKLFSQSSGGTAGELITESETEFFSQRANVRISFQMDAQGKVIALTMNLGGYVLTAPRVEQSMVEEIRATLAARIESQAAVPGSEAALRRLIEGVLNGEPDYSMLTPAMAHVLRRQLPSLHTVSKYLGDLRSIEFKGVGTQGWDVYDVRREHGTARWRIALDSAGLVAGAVAVITDGPVSAGP